MNELKLSSPITEEEWDMITDVDFDRTEHIYFHTKHDKDVHFYKRRAGEDAVIVVRCKDCKFYLNLNEKCVLVDTRLRFYETDKKWTGDSFCSWGERKERNENEKSDMQ